MAGFDLVGYVILHKYHARIPATGRFSPGNTDPEKGVEPGQHFTCRRKLQAEADQPPSICNRSQTFEGSLCTGKKDVVKYRSLTFF